MRFVLIGIALALAASASAAPERAAPSTPSAPSAPQGTPLIRALKAAASGQPVVAVGLPGLPDAEIATGFSPDERLLQRLQQIGEVAGTPDLRLIPFAVGSAWVLAPDTREEFISVDPDAGPLEHMAPSVAMGCFLASLTPAQVQELGSPAGLSARELRGTARAALARALAPPLLVSERLEPEVRAPEEPGEGKRWRDLGRLDEPLDLSRLRLFACLTVTSALFRIDDNTQFHISIPPASERLLRRDGADVSAGTKNVLVAPRLAVVPNRYKPSDLSGRSLPQPLGLDGVHTVREVLAAASRATGHSLHVTPMWRDIPVFIGRADLPSGDVLDALCLALEGAWRKLGGKYVLAWDVRGLAPLQRSVIEELHAVEGKSARLRDMAVKSRAWVQIAQSLPFDQDIVLALTERQRTTLQPVRPEEGYRLALEEMETYQQEFLRARARTQPIAVYSEDGSEYQRFLDPEEIESAEVIPDLEIAVTVEGPPFGRLRLDLGSWDATLTRRYASFFGIFSNGLERAIQEQNVTPAMLNDPALLAEPEIDIADEDADDQDDSSDEESPPALGRPVIPSPVRAVMVPPLGPGTLEALAVTMRRHGFNTLFYPVLYDGYATILLSAFPLHPALRGKDGLAAAVSAAGSDIRVIPYINTLTWRGADQPDYWLRRRPGWFQRDLLGRTRSEWLASHPLDDKELHLDVSVDRDYVSASEPEVRSRLQALLKEVATRGSLGGLAICDWLGLFLSKDFDVSEMPDPEVQPLMGFTPASRLAYMRETGLDPVDLTLWPHAPFVPRALAASEEGLEKWRLEVEIWDEDPDVLWGVGLLRPHLLLASSLLRSAKTLRPDWETYLFEYGDTYRTLAKITGPESSGKGASEKLAMPDHTVGVFFLAGDQADGVSIPLTPSLADEFMREPGFLKGLHELTEALRIGLWRIFPFFSIPVYFQPPDSPRQTVRFDPPRITVLNFQRAPWLMVDVLRPFRPPTPDDLAPPKPAPAPNPRKRVSSE